MDIFEAAKKVQDHVLASVNENTIQTNGVVAIKGNMILHFRSESDALHLNGGVGYVFTYLYRNGQVELTPSLG